MSDGIEKATPTDMLCCASCGKAEVDDVQLKKCACNLVKYCSFDCQKNHRPQHKKTCKKRLAEIRDDRLFQQPDGNHYGECPICCLPLPLGNNKWNLNSCCSKRTCDGCDWANTQREKEQGLEHKCPYCREPVPNTEEEYNKNERKRAKVNDPIALLQVGKRCYNEGDYEGAIQHWTKAAEMGDMDGHYELSCLYHEGKGVAKDMKKAVHHWEQAAIGGHASARNNLGCYEGCNGRFDRAMKHFIIAANLGHDKALEQVKEGFRRGYLSKEDFAAALRGHQAAVDAAKSQQREEAYRTKREGLFY